MAKYFIKMDELKEQGEELQKYATDVIETKINELLQLVKQFDWTGPAYEAYINLYQEKVNKLFLVPKMINAYGKFMATASDGFTDVNNQIEKMTNELTSTLNNEKGGA